MTVIKRDILTPEEQKTIDGIMVEVKKYAKESKELSYRDGKILDKEKDMSPEERERCEEIGDALMTLHGQIDAITKTAEYRYTTNLGSSVAVYNDAIEIIEAATKEDFREHIRPLAKGFSGKQNIQLRKDSKEFRTYMHYDFKSARVFLLKLVSPHIDYLKKHDEKPDGIDFTYLELLDVSIYRKVRDEWKYKQPPEKKTERQKKETLSSLDYAEPSDVYTKRLEDGFIKEVGLLIGEKAPLNKVASKKTIETPSGQIEFRLEDTDLTPVEKEDMYLTNNGYVVLDMILEKMTAKLPPVPAKNKDGSINAAKMEEIKNVLKDEGLRTITITRDQFAEERNIAKNNSRIKAIFEDAIMSLGNVYWTSDKEKAKPYNIFSSPPHKPADMYDKGGLCAVLNYDWLVHLYIDGAKGKGQLVWRPRPLRSIDQNKYPLAQPLWNWLHNNYNYNVGKQNPHTDRVKVGTTIDKVPELRRRDAEQQSGGKKFYERVIKPLQENLDALDKEAKILEYSYLDKDKKPITKSKFNKLKYAQQKECWIKYEFVDYPNWKAPAQLENTAE